MKEKNKRIGRNPKTNKIHEITKRIVTTFKISERLKKKIDSNASK